MNNLGILWITGATGLVGTKLVEAAIECDCFGQIYAFAHTQAFSQVKSSKVIWSTLDIGNKEALQLAFRNHKPDVIINSAAVANVDICELYHQKALYANYRGAQYLAEVSYQSNAHLIHISTDYVFPGDEKQPGPYIENSAPHPINFYGQTKLQGECAIIDTCKGRVPYTIVRTSLVYGPIESKHSNFIAWLVSELKAGRQVRVVRDQWNTPTLVDDLVHTILWLAQCKKTGVYHVAGSELISRHKWAYAIASYFGLNTDLISNIKSSELGQIAERPRLSGLLCERLHGDQSAPNLHNVIEGLMQITLPFPRC